MKQTISICLDFDGRSYGIKMDCAYEINGNLVAIAHITHASRRGEIVTSKSSLTVKTNSESKLPVRFYIINNTGQPIPINQNNIEEVVGFGPIKELENHQPLKIARPLSAQYAGLLLAAKTPADEQNIVWDRELDSFPIEAKPPKIHFTKDIEEDEPFWCAPM